MTDDDTAAQPPPADTWREPDLREPPDGWTNEERPMDDPAVQPLPPVDQQPWTDDELATPTKRGKK